MIRFLLSVLSAIVIVVVSGIPAETLVSRMSSAPQRASRRTADS